MVEEVIGRVILGVVMAGSGVALVWVARATASGRLGRNEWAGIRTATTTASDEAWLAAHRRAQGRSVWAGAVCVVCGLLAAVVAVPLVTFMVVLLVASVVVLALVLDGVRVGHRAVRELGEYQVTRP